jgi:nucleoside-diphosphate-sugar epimerase
VKVLVTGATGFIGGHLVDALVEKDYEVRCLVRKTSNTEHLKKLGVELVYGNITEPNSIEKVLDGIDTIYHLAGVLGQWGVPDKVYWDVHVQGTQNLLEASQKHDIRKFIYCSTAGVTGPGFTLPQDEYLPYNPSNTYENTKAEAEKLVIKYHHENGLPVVVIRPEFIYGPGDMHTLGLFKTIRKRMFVLIDGGKAIWHPTYIDDLIQSFLLCLNNPRAIGEVYIIAGERYVTLKELAIIIAKELNVPSPTLSLPKGFVFVLSAVDQLTGKVFKFDPPLTIPRVKTLCRSGGCSTLKAREQLGYSPTVTLEEGVRQTAQWYRENGYL